MTADIESLVLEHLRAIRAKVDRLAETAEDMSYRLSRVEHAVLQGKREILLCEETDTRQQIAMDRLTARVERLERRLELSD